MIEILANRSVIHISGTDAAKFLQSMTTNDVIKNSFSYNYLLTNQGRYLFDFFTFKENDNSYYIEIDQTASNNFLQRLNLYKLRSNIIIEDLSNKLAVIYSKKKPNIDYFTSNQDCRFEKLGFRTITQKENIKHLTNINMNLYLDDKYDYAIPDGSCDLVYDKSIPVEYGAEQLSAISYNKGCYVGQEVISRVKYQGVVRKKIYKLISKSDMDLSHLKLGDIIMDLEGNKIGAFCSGYKNKAIALLREEKYLSLNQKTAVIDNVEANIFVPEWL